MINVSVAEIVLKNSTGNRQGYFIQYEYGEDLFGYLYLDIARRKLHRGKKLKSLLFQDLKDFIITLDMELYRKETLNYLPEP